MLFESVFRSDYNNEREAVQRYRYGLYESTSVPLSWLVSSLRYEPQKLIMPSTSFMEASVPSTSLGISGVGK